MWGAACGMLSSTCAEAMTSMRRAFGCRQAGDMSDQWPICSFAWTCLNGLMERPSSYFILFHWLGAMFCHQDTPGTGHHTILKVEWENWLLLQHVKFTTLLIQGLWDMTTTCVPLPCDEVFPRCMFHTLSWNHFPSGEQDIRNINWTFSSAPAHGSLSLA